MENTAPVVIDNGSGFCKVGYGGNDKPNVFPDEVAYVKKSINLSKPAQRRWQVGNDIYEQKAIMDYKYPVDRGIIKDWESLVHIWDFCLNEVLKVRTGPERGCLLIECKRFLMQPQTVPTQTERRWLRLCLAHLMSHSYALPIAQLWFSSH